MVQIVPDNLCVNEILVRALLDRGVVGHGGHMIDLDLGKTLLGLMLSNKWSDRKLDAVESLEEDFFFEEASDLIHGRVNAYSIT